MIYHNTITALYERLSKDDDVQGESNSITNQKTFLEDYASKNGFLNIRHYTDDGYSGKNFNRPAIQKMLADIARGDVGTVIVKDMSRFGRNYLEVGFYTEIEFPKKEVRFIAVNNNVDSQKTAENDFTPFINIMNEWYVRDTSNKIKAIFNARMNEGKRCSGSVPYGYNRNLEDPKTLIVDPVASQVVKHIFDLADKGFTPTAIANELRDSHILTPSTYNYNNHPEQRNSKPGKDPYNWSNTTICQILDKEEYLGHTILRKSISTNFKTGARRKTTDKERLFFPNTHEPIISETQWDSVHKKMLRYRKKSRGGIYKQQGLFVGLLYCADCGSRMVPNRWTDDKGEERFTYRCQNYKGKDGSCTTHSISEKSLIEVVTTLFRRILNKVLSDEESFANDLREHWNIECEVLPKRIKDEQASINGRYSELDTKIKKLYEHFSRDLIPERQYIQLLDKYKAEQKVLERRGSDLEEDYRKKNEEPSINEFVSLIRKYKDLKEMDLDLLDALIEKIVVHQATNSGNGKTVELDVYYNFIGQFDFEPTEDEVKEREEKEHIKELERKEKYRKRNAESWKKTKERRYAENDGHRFSQKICEVCGKSYWPTMGRQKYCSKGCSYKVALERTRKNRNTHEAEQCNLKKCIVCGELFLPSNGKQLLCSDECRKKHTTERARKYYREVISEKDKQKREENRNLVREHLDGHLYPQKKCLTCGELYWPTKESQKYCCKKCGNKGWSNSTKGFEQKDKDGHYFYKKICVICGREFWPNGPAEVCCSDDCRKERVSLRNKERNEIIRQAKYQKNDGHMYPIKNCMCCGQEFWPNAINQIYCSHACSVGSRFFKRTGLPFVDREGHKYAKKVCVVCGIWFWPNGPNTLVCSEECRKKRITDRSNDGYNIIYNQEF